MILILVKNHCHFSKLLYTKNDSKRDTLIIRTDGDVEVPNSGVDLPQAFARAHRWVNDPIMVGGRRRWRIKYIFTDHYFFAKEGIHDNEQKGKIRDSLKFIEAIVSNICMKLV